MLNAKCGMAKLCIALRHSAFIIMHSAFLLDIRLLQTKVFLGIDALQDDADNQCGNTEASEHDQGPGVVILCGGDGRIQGAIVD